MWIRINFIRKQQSNIHYKFKTNLIFDRTVNCSYLASLVVKPDQSMIPGEDFAVEGGVVLGRPTASHRPADLDWLVQVHMSLLEWVRVGSAGEHSQR